MITESLTTTGQHVLCRYCGRPIRFYPVTVSTNDATGESIRFLAPDYHETCRRNAHEVVCVGTKPDEKKKEIPYWVSVSRKYDRKQALRRR